MKRWVILFVLAGTVAWAVAVSSRPANGDAPPAGDAPWLWVYAPCNFQVDANADHTNLTHLCLPSAQRSR